MRLGATVTTLSQQDGEVDVAFADGSTGTYDLVVGADGIHSSIRQLVFGSIRPRHLAQVSWRFLVDQSGVIETWTVMLAWRRAFLAMPVGPNRLYCYADLATAATEDPTGRDLGRFLALFADFGEPVPSILSGLGNFDSIHFFHRGGRPRSLDLLACRASWRCGARDITQHGRGCVHGAGRCVGAGPAVGDAWLAGRGLVSVPRTPAHSHPLGAAEHTAGIASGLCQFRFAISRSVWQGPPFISEIIECCSRNHSQRVATPRRCRVTKLRRTIKTGSANRSPT